MNPVDDRAVNAGETADAVSLQTLFKAFLRVGLTAFGGPAMIPHIRRLVLDKHAWISERDFRLGMAVCQVLPGATVMQLAAYVGFRTRGLAGALAAFAGFGLPAFALITLLSAWYFKYQDTGGLLSAFAGLKVVVVAVIAHACVEFVRKYTTSIQDTLIGIGAACGILLQVHPALLVAAAMLLGVAIHKDDAVPGKPVPVAAPCCGNRPLGRLLGGLCLVVFLVALCSSSLLEVMLRMMRVDVFAFGGGFAALPMMLHEVVHVAGWLTEKTFLDGIALGQVTPGPIVITSAFVGYAVQGLAGAVVAAVGIFSPSLLVLVWAVPHCDRLLGSRHFRKAMHASLATLGGLMAATAVTLVRAVEWNAAGAALCAAVLAALMAKVDVVWVVFAGTALGMLVL